jgi:hypothetical protein
MRRSQKVYKTFFEGEIVDGVKKYASVEVCKLDFGRGGKSREGNRKGRWKLG